MKRLLILVGSALLLSCAQPGRPSGGAIDESPPVVVKSDPENLKTLFDRKLITIEFDEYISLKNPTQNVVVTPPLEKDPEFTMRGKTLEIELNTVLEDSTTYVINFGNSIQDLNEGNVLEDFKFIFSTGEYLDSLMVYGVIRSAILNEVPEGIRVHLYTYTSKTDSIPSQEIPQYFSAVKSDGTFSITNIKPGKYQVFALADANSNYLYDQPNEIIGFTDPIDLKDSAEIQISAFLPTPEYKLTRMRYDASNTIKAAFNRPVSSVEISSLSHPDVHFQSEISIEGDSAYFYFIPPASDTIEIALNADGNRDTLTIRLKDFPTSKLQTRSSNIKGGFLNMNDTLCWTFNYPIERVDTSLIAIRRDSIPIAFSAIISGRTMSLVFEKNYDSKYSITVNDSALTSLYCDGNDSLGLLVSTAKEIDLGAFILNFNPPDSTKYIVQLTDGKGNVRREIRIRGQNRIHWEDLNPEKLTLRAIRDADEDGAWTTGSYWEHRQPEKVYYFPESIEIKPNWEIEYTWNEEQFKL